MSDPVTAQLEQLRAQHRAAPLAAAELGALDERQLRVLALDEALHGPLGALRDPWPPAIAEHVRRRRSRH